MTSWKTKGSLLTWGFTPEADRELLTQRLAMPQTDIATLSALMVGTVAMLSCLDMGSLCWWCCAARCFCTANEVTGVAVADEVLQGRISDRAEELFVQINTGRLKATPFAHAVHDVH